MKKVVAEIVYTVQFIVSQTRPLIYSRMSHQNRPVNNDFLAEMIIIAINKQLIIIQLPVNCGWKVWYDLRTSYAVSIETVTPSRQCRQQLNVNNLKLNGTEWKTLVFHLTICIVENVSARKLMRKTVLNGNLERLMETGKHRWHQYSKVFHNWCIIMWGFAMLMVSADILL